MSIPPVLGPVFLLLVASSLRGVTNGLSQPLLISMVLRASGSVGQGKAVGLRGTCNRVASVSAPILMGALAELVGIENSFYVVGLVITVLMALLMRHAMNTPDRKDRPGIGEMASGVSEELSKTGRACAPGAKAISAMATATAWRTENRKNIGRNLGMGSSGVN